MTCGEDSSAYFGASDTQFGDEKTALWLFYKVPGKEKWLETIHYLPFQW